MQQAPIPPQGYPQPQQQQQQQQQFPGQQGYPSGFPGVGVPGTPGGMNMGTPGTVLPNGQFVPAGTPDAILPNGQMMANPPFYAPSPGGGFVGAPNSGPVITREQQQIVGVPPGMTRESMQPGYDPRLKQQRRVWDPRYSFKDSFGRHTNRRCCTIS